MMGLGFTNSLMKFKRNVLDAYDDLMMNLSPFYTSRHSVLGLFQSNADVVYCRRIWECIASQILDDVGKYRRELNMAVDSASRR